MTSVLAWLVAVSVSAPSAATVVVLPARRTGVSAEELRRVADATLAALGERGIATVGFEDAQRRLKAAGVSDTLACGGRPPCLLSAATRLGATHAVLLSGLQVDADRAWVLEALAVETGASLLKRDWTDAAASPSTTATADFAAQLATALVGPSAAPTPVATPASPPPPLVPVATPPAEPTQPQPPSLTQATPPPPPPSKVAPKVLLVVAGVLAAAAIGTAVAGALTDAELAKQSGGVSPLTHSQALRTRDTANVLFGVAWGAGGLAAGAGAVALLTW